MQELTNNECPSVSQKATKLGRLTIFAVAAHFWIVTLVAASHAQGDAKAQYFFRNPTGHGSTVIFEFSGHIWQQDGESVAKRVTDAATDETAPIVSPDGLLVAYVVLGASSDEVFVASLASGEATRLTFDGGFDVKVQGWLSAHELLYSTTVYSGKRGPLLFAVDTRTHQSRAIPLVDAAEACVLGDYFIYVKNQELTDSNRLYNGGYAQHINKIEYDLVLGHQRNLLDHKASSVPLTNNYSGISRNPLCIGDQIFFLSDRDGRFNIWSMAADGGHLVQHTFERDFDIRSMTTSDGTAIFYQLGGEIFRLDTTGGPVRLVDIHIPGSVVTEAKRFVFEPADATEFAVSDDGTRAALVIRGKLWAIEPGGGTAICIDCHSDRRVKSPMLSPDGKTIFAMNDSSGEYDIFAYEVRDASVRHVGHQINDPILDFSVSPNGHDMLVRSIAGDLYHVDAANGVTVRIDLVSLERPNDVSWSPDGRFATFVTYTVDGIGRITTFDVECGSVTYLTDGHYDVSSPVFSNDSSEIYYIADTYYRSTLDDTWKPNGYWPAYDNNSLIYAVDVSTLSRRRPVNQRPSMLNSGRAAHEAVCPDQVAERGTSRGELLLTRELPFVAGNYDRLLLDGGYLHSFAKRAVRDQWGRIVAFDHDLHGSRSAPRVVFDEEIHQYAISATGRSIIARTAGELFVSSVDASGEFGPPVRLANVAGLDVQIDLADERKQMFNELWRMYRDYFFDPSMNGVNWKGEREKYRVFLPRVSNEIEFDEVVADMVSELGAGHTSLGTAAPAGRQGVARLGGELDEVDHLRVVKVFDGDLDIMEERAPLSLTTPPVNVGDRIMRVNGVEVTSRVMLDEMLYGRVGQPVALTVEKPDGQIYENRVVPISSGRETWLRYKSWVANNTEKVNELSGGTVGYVHLQSSYESDFSNFIRQYAYLHQRRALILDLRGNNGGNMDTWLLHFLQRRTWLNVAGRYDSRPIRYPRRSFDGKLIVLIDGDTYSDGELIAEGVRRLQLGILIGTRTSGAGKWVNNDKTLINGTKVRIPESGSYILKDGKPSWVIEGHGVEPDIRVENDPYLFYLGLDAQLKAAVDNAMEAPRQ